ncbi:hypothetical protein EW026_g5098 [Hermanssonia centrifuga]|uniref:Tubulin nucleotide-binding domain-like protein n=1 Tax=Hermanssonia centrifuga TaxID=98765 RepID=A0A4S4KJH3_9APHY|nr:hypothetical protein EW026_g5098 [Hermanssonia centrifuga]
MKEIIYFQAGNFANYIGSHFWNTQEGYFTYGDEAEDPTVNHDISFREGLTAGGHTTFSPRLLIVDRKSNLGSSSDLYGEAEGTDELELLSQWNGNVAEYRQEPISKSDYHAKLDAEEEALNEKDRDEEDPIQADDSKIRFWSDYNRVYFHPRTIHSLPDLSDWENVEGDWALGRDTFYKFNEDTDFMEESFRPFVEECDSLQGIQVTDDTANFGSFTHTFLTRFRDEFVKLPCLLKEGSDDLSSLSNRLNWRGNTSFSHLSGTFPLSSPFTPEADLEKRIYDLTAVSQDSTSKLDPTSTFARMDVSRGFLKADITVYDERTIPFRPLLYSVHAPVIPIPSSYPAYFKSRRPSAATAFSSVVTSSRTAPLFASYASLAEDCMHRHTDVIDKMGLEKDDIRQLKEDLWALEDGYKDDEQFEDTDIGEEAEM